MKNTFFALLWCSFRRVQGFLLAALSILASVLFWQVKPDAKVPVPLSLAVPLGMFLVILIATLVDLGIESLSLHSRLPRVRFVSKSNPGETLIFLLDSSELFSHNAVVSFYYVGDSGFEQLIGFGVVRNIQQDGLIQVRMSKTVDGQTDIIQSLSQNQSGTLKRMVVKPVADARYIQDLVEGTYGE